MQFQATLFESGKRCADCREIKPLAEFNRRNRGDGYYEYCRACHNRRNREYEREHREDARVRYLRWIRNNRERNRETARAWRLAHPEKQTEYARRYRYANDADRSKARARKAATRDETAAEYVEIIFCDPCSYCNGSAGTIDHIDALSAGGENHWTNYTAACLACNGGKRERSLLKALLLHLD